MPDPDDRRRTNLELTPQGQAAAVEIRAAVDGVDAALAGKVGIDAVRTMRRVVAALPEVAEPDGDDDTE